MRTPTSGTLIQLLGAGGLPDVVVGPAKPELEPPAVVCAHERHQRDMRVHENEFRVRIVETCRPCGVRWHHCYAKRLSPEADQAGSREWWGPVGEWATKVERLGAQPAPATVLQITRQLRRKKGRGHGQG